MNTLSTTKIITFMATVMAVGLLVFGLTAVSINALNSNGSGKSPSDDSDETTEFTSSAQVHSLTRTANPDRFRPDEELHSGYHAFELTAVPDIPTN